MKKGCAFLLCLVGFLGASNPYEPQKTIRVYKQFHEFEPQLSKNNDTTFLINFWATWCKPCIKELPAFEEINRTYQNQKVKVLLVSLDFENQLENRLIPFVEKKGLEAEVVLLADDDYNSWIEKIDPSWSGALPGTLIYNSRYRKFYERDFEYHELDSVLNLAL